MTYKGINYHRALNRAPQDLTTKQKEIWAEMNCAGFSCIASEEGFRDGIKGKITKSPFSIVDDTIRNRKWHGGFEYGKRAAQ